MYRILILPDMELIEEKNIRLESARLGAEIALSRLGLIKDDISQVEAFRVFGRAKIESWRNQGLVTRIKTGPRNSKATYSRIELETVRDLERKNKIR